MDHTVLPSCSVSLPDEATATKATKISVSVKSTVIRKTFPRKVKKLSRRRRQAKRRMEKHIKERNEMASSVRGPYDCYWDNYFRCMKWMQNHNASYWHSRAQALEYENNYLRSIIEKNSSSQPNLSEELVHNGDCKNNFFYPNDVSNSRQEAGHETEVDHQNCNFNSPECYNRRNQTDQRDEVENEYGSDSEEFEFEVDDNMIEFFTQSMKHKMELQREREQNDDKDSNQRHNTYGSSRFQRKKSDNVETKKVEEFSYDECMMGLKRVLPVQCFEQNKTVEGKDLEDILLQKTQREEKEKLRHELFGKSASKILGMETAMQLNFRQFCASKRPVMWPIIPLNL